jgi:hypothetical protein
MASDTRQNARSVDMDGIRAKKILQVAMQGGKGLSQNCTAKFLYGPSYVR